MNYVDLDINAASRTPKMRDESVSYAEVIIPKSRKEHANESNQQVNEYKQQIKAATLKVCCNNICVLSTALLVLWPVWLTQDSY